MRSLCSRIGRKKVVSNGSPVDARLLRLLENAAVTIEAIDASTCHLTAVPVGREFNKPRTNLLIKRMQFALGSNVFVDDDVIYLGGDREMVRLFDGPTYRKWRKLRVPPVKGMPDAVLIYVLRLLRSPLAKAGQWAIRRRRRRRTPTAAMSLGPMLSLIGEILPATVTEHALETTVHVDLVQHLATVATRTEIPRSSVLWGAAGSGRDHMMLAVAHQLRQHGNVRRVLRVSAARIAARCVHMANLDTAFAQFLDEALSARDVLLLMQDLDVCFSASQVSYSLLCHALDQGLRMVATVRHKPGFDQLLDDKALARRLVAVQMKEPAKEAIEEIARNFAATCRVEVLPETIQTAVCVAMNELSGSPAATVSLLSAAIADAAWNQADCVGPDNVFAGRRNQWFGE